MVPILLQQGIPTSIDGIVAQYGDALVSFAVTVLTVVVAFLALYLNARVWIDPDETGAVGVKNTLIERGKHRFDEEGVGMPYPHRELVGSLSVESVGADSGIVSDD